MVRTSSYKEFQKSLIRTKSISWDRGKDADYHGECYPALAPKKTFWREWKNNLGKIPEEENNRQYIEEYWKQVLSELDPEEVYREVDACVLLCYEKNMEFCHRHIVAAWFEILLGVKVPEVKNENYKLKEVERPAYIKEFLEEAMRKDRNMRGFKSLRALYLFEKSEKYEAEIDKLEERTGKNYDIYRQYAAILRSDADMAEHEYREQEDQKRLIRTPEANN